MTAAKACENPRCHYGYPEFVKFMSTANNFSVFRSFDRLNNRMILHLQEDLRLIEKEWDDLDRNAEREGVSRGCLQADEVNHEQEANGEPGAYQKHIRNYLVKRTIEQVMFYNRFLASYERLKQHPPAQERDITSIKTWLNNRQKYREADSQAEPEGPIREEERQYLLAPDCVALLPTANPTRLRRTLEKYDRFLWLKCFQEDVHPSLDQIHAHNDCQLRDDAKADLAMEAVAVIAAFITFFIPLWVLAYVSGRGIKLGISTVLIAVFWVVLFFGTNARSEVRIAGCAGYMAVLVAIMQINN